MAASSTGAERAKGKPVIVVLHKELEVQPTGKAKVTVTVASTPPQPGSEPSVTKYEFEAE